MHTIVAEIMREKPLSGSYEEVLFGSDSGNTLWVKFSSDEGNPGWIGKFGCGSGCGSSVSNLSQSDRFMISADGYAYIIDSSSRTVLDQCLEDLAQEIVYDPKRGLFVVADHVRLRMYASVELVWTSPRIALDRLHSLSVKDGVLHGIAVTGFEGEEDPFTLDLETRQITCRADFSGWDRADEGRGKKPWWKFW